jgi:hypothetical protein
MNTFKLSSKTIHTDERSSIENKHNETIDKYNKYYSLLPNKEKEISKLKKLLEYVKDNDEKYKLKSQINKLSNEIDDIKLQKGLTEYMLNSIEFIEQIDNENFVENANKSSAGILQFIDVEGTYENGKLYNEYLMKCFPDENNNISLYTGNTFLCKYCNSNTVKDTTNGYIICETCCITETRTTSDIPEWGIQETHDITKAFSYKRINHFKEWISQLQGKETTVIPTAVIDLLLLEIKKERITDTTCITYDKTKGFLRKLKLNKYYEHIPNIIHVITCNPQLKINSKLEKQLLGLFEKIQAPFEKHCPKDRKNFLSYSYTLYKFCQILGKNEYLVYFPLLKSRQKLFEQENIWKNICKELDWTFIPCI